MLHAVCFAQLPCPSGRYGDVPAETSPTCAGACAPGFECPEGSVKADTGVCPKGYFCQGGPRQPCPAGRYSDGVGTVSAAACVACPAGSYSARTAATTAATCVPCDPFDDSGNGSVACWPGVLSAFAFNPPPVTPGFSVGDVVVINFSSPTNTSAIVVFSPPIGVTSSSWRPGNRQLWLTVVVAVGVNASAVDVAMGALSVSVSGVFSADHASSASTGVALTVGGTWGVPAPPVIVDVTAADGGRNVGPGTGDTLVVTFDQAVRQVAGVQTPMLLAGLVSLQPPFPSGVVVAGSWTSQFSLALSLNVADGPLPNWTQWNVGALTVTILPDANLTSFNGESGASNSSAVLRGGSWGDAPSLAVSPKNATAVVLTLALPNTTVGYAANTFVVQWSTTATFAGAGDVPSAVADVEMWAMTGVPSSPGVDGSNRAVASIVLASSAGPGTAVDAAVVRLTVPAASLVSPLRFDIPRLTTSTTYFVRGACSGPAGTMGPVVPSDPPSITPQPPRVLFVAAPAAGVPTAGGIVLEATGEQLGVDGSVVSMLLSSADFGPFRSADCEVTDPGTRIRCTSPAGVGTGLAIVVSVDGVSSPPYPNGTLSYSSPAITGLRVVSGGAEGGGGGVPTSGGALVVVEGLNFGPASLAALSLGAVTYSPITLSVTQGTPVSFPALHCAITRNHTELTCEMGPGVGGGLLWSVSIAGQTASTATTSYHKPVITSVGVVAAGGGVSSAPAALHALVTQGGQELVCAWCRVVSMSPFVRAARVANLLRDRLPWCCVCVVGRRCSQGTSLDPPAHRCPL